MNEKKGMRWCFDIDGVITANPAAIAWLTYHLLKNENNNEVYILTWRDGSDEKRRAETEQDLGRFGIVYTKLIMAPRRFDNLRTAAFWKVSQLDELKVDIWFDDEIKNYKRDLGIDLDRLLPNTKKVWI